MTTSLHTCTAENCDRQIRVGLLMCLQHWRMVPAPLQQEIYRTYRNWCRAPLGDGGLCRREYVAAVRQARAAVREKEIKRALKSQQHGDVLNFE